MIDLHLHTVFSDGTLKDISCFEGTNSIISVTDHNSIGFFKENPLFLKKLRIIIGCEITVTGTYDILLYFPNLTNYSDSLEFELSKIRLNEALIIKSCYEELGYDNWEYDISRAFPKEQRIKDARTRDLAAIIYLKRNNLEYANGEFEREDLIRARKSRMDYADKHKNSVNKNVAFEIGKKFKGETSLAHPIRTLLKMYRDVDPQSSDFLNKLYELMISFKNKGGQGLEIELVDNETIDKYSISPYLLKKIRNEIFDFSLKNNMYLTTGSDAHCTKNCNHKLDSVFFERFPAWVKNTSTF